MNQVTMILTNRHRYHRHVHYTHWPTETTCLSPKDLIKNSKQKMLVFPPLRFFITEIQILKLFYSLKEYNLCHSELNSSCYNYFNF